MRTGNITFGPTLPFGDVRSQMPDVGSLGNPRQEKIDRARERVDPLFVERYRRFLLLFSQDHADFIAGEVTAEFEKQFKPLDASEKKALGGLYQQLQREGSIETTGSYRKRNQGNPSAVYRRKSV